MPARIKQTVTTPRTQVANRQKRFIVNRRRVAFFCDAVLEALGRSGFSLSVSFVSRRAIHALNLRYRGEDHATDVLGFPYPGATEEGKPLLGEIVISPEVASNHARRWGSDLEREARKLLVHGILHILGYDHDRDVGEMRRLERRLSRRRVVSGPGSLLERRR